MSERPGYQTTDVMDLMTRAGEKFARLIKVSWEAGVGQTAKLSRPPRRRPALRQGSGRRPSKPAGPRGRATRAASARLEKVGSRGPMEQVGAKEGDRVAQARQHVGGGTAGRAKGANTLPSPGPSLLSAGRQEAVRNQKRTDDVTTTATAAAGRVPGVAGRARAAAERLEWRPWCRIH